MFKPGQKIKKVGGEQVGIIAIFAGYGACPTNPICDGCAFPESAWHDSGGRHYDAGVIAYILTSDWAPLLDDRNQKTTWEDMYLELGCDVRKFAEAHA